MAITAGINIQILVNGDGTSTTATFDLSQIPYLFLDGGAVSNDFALKGGLVNPTSVQAISLDDSKTDLPTATIAGDVATFTFPSPLAAGLHQLNCVVFF